MERNKTVQNENLSKVEMDALIEVTKQMTKIINRKEFAQIVSIYYEASKRLENTGSQK